MRWIAFLQVVSIGLPIVYSNENYKKICKNHRHDDINYMKPDPFDCSKFIMCDNARQPHPKDCAGGTTFNPNLNHGMCDWPGPDQVPNCRKNQGVRYRSKFLSQQSCKIRRKTLFLEICTSRIWLEV